MTTPLRRAPLTGFLLWGILPTVVAISALSRDPLDVWSNLLGAYAIAWWLAAAYLRRGRSATVLPALLLIALPWFAALAQTVRRVVFVIREGGMEGADGAGSPMAFVLGIVFEQGFVFIPLTVIAIRVWRANPQRSAQLSS